jgi:hypothetical protein
MKNLEGTWLTIKKGDYYEPPEFIEFEDDQIIHYELEEDRAKGLVKKRTRWTEKISEAKYEFVNERRIRIYRMGRLRRIISETESIIEYKEHVTDYEKIVPTQTALTAEQIQQLEFYMKWNNEEGPLVFNKNLYSPELQKISKKVAEEELKFVLEELQGTYFVSTYEFGKRQTLLGIKEVDEEKAVLYLLPDEPYEITALRLTSEYKR